jgi:hypothetical protein
LEPVGLTINLNNALGLIDPLNRATAWDLLPYLKLLG